VLLCVGCNRQVRWSVFMGAPTRHPAGRLSQDERRRDIGAREGEPRTLKSETRSTTAWVFPADVPMGHVLSRLEDEHGEVDRSRGTRLPAGQGGIYLGRPRAEL